MKNLSSKQVGISILVFAFLFLVLLIILKMQVDQYSLFMCSAVAANPSMDMSQCPVHNGSMSWVLTLGFVLDGLLILFASYLLIPKVSSKPRVFQSIDKKSLDKDEITVYDLLVGSNGEMYQSKLVGALDFGKVKVTRILDKLESKGIVERRRRGMANLVLLK
tara:strand:+ start:602 stop:1090 length:489 start_codon:yes stop_codon:yes gene_type:complete